MKKLDAIKMAVSYFFPHKKYEVIFSFERNFYPGNAFTDLLKAYMFLRDLSFWSWLFARRRKYMET